MLMEMKVSRIIEDERKIKAIYNHDQTLVVGDSSGITEIVPYEEDGEMAAVTWLAIYQGKKLWIRVPARTVTIEY